MYKGKVKATRRPKPKTYYHFSGGSVGGDSRMTKREMMKNKEYRKLLMFLQKEKEKRDETTK